MGFDAKFTLIKNDVLSELGSFWANDEFIPQAGDSVWLHDIKIHKQYRIIERHFTYEDSVASIEFFVEETTGDDCRSKSK